VKIDYKILWLDDQIKNFEDDELIDELATYLVEAGFRPVIDTVNNSESFFGMLNVSYDLILTDFHMNDMQGDKVVEKIRSSEYSILTEILFYTAKADLSGADKISRVSFLETSKKPGSHQDVVLEETKKLIDITIKKFQHIVAMRGMIMHETSSLDTKMNGILNSFLENDKNTDNIKILANVVLQELEAQFCSKLSDIQKWRKNCDLKRTSKDNFVFSSHYKIKTMGEILKLLNEEDFSKHYDEKINKVRNCFAHAVLERDPATAREFFKQGDLTFDEALCKQIRKDILQQDANLERLINIIAPTP